MRSMDETFDADIVTLTLIPSEAEETMTSASSPGCTDVKTFTPFDRSYKAEKMLVMTVGEEMAFL